ncbi:MAG: 23S rRNA (uracil(1939)-C(5))-methyltransferase RlmD [Gammaproteobacteria bacterium]|nr:23S rRNA (uracil(1939)-C(5))-methyltransferase RlmD [Gammaproteobacteria bacterium]MDH3373575.1 23S rRNA (uracil(1939)-C(5))-methyltransferase RlmD [Gammaproteobacteria bacterium]MDH3408647.1 23S rRNA (uracil(1939)-C(5))-methyltransferase RlmD [Gammaproteobacteria bacterium]
MARRRRREPETARIDSCTHDGRGIVAGEGKKVFVAGALEGEQVRYLRRKSRRNYDEAELLEILDASPHRIAARCAVFGRCGGCALQHVSDVQQRQIKFQALKDNLQRIGQITSERWLEPMIGPVWNYRRRARLAVKDVQAKGRVLVGFRERHAPYITDMHRCEVLAEPVDSMIDPLSELIGGLSIRARLPQVEVAVADNAVALVFRVLDEPTAEDTALLRDFGADHELRIYLQPGGLESITLLYPESPADALYYDLAEFDVRIAFDAAGFVQVNSEINRRMVHQAIELLDPGPADRVLDLYCGIGNFSLPLARRAGTVLGVEGEAVLVEAATQNAASNGLHNVSFRQADLSAIDGSETWLREGWNKVLLDPARSGAAEIVAAMKSIGAERIVYVSCHPGTLARDAGTLVNDHGYRCEAAGIIDMFPHTAHMESIAVFNK